MTSMALVISIIWLNTKICPMDCTLHQHPLLDRLLQHLHCRRATCSCVSSACLHSRYRLCGKERSTTKDSWFWLSLHAGWCAKAGSVCDKKYRETSSKFEAKSKGHYQKLSKILHTSCLTRKCGSTYITRRLGPEPVWCAQRTQGR